MEATPDVVDIAPHGNVVLICGTDGNRLRVWSNVLKLASPVFEAMLERRFAEGTQLAAAGQVEIPLPDDDAAAMSCLCKALHYDHTTLSTTPALQILLNIAVLADKYECVPALVNTAYRWIRDSSHQVKYGEDVGRHEKLLLAAYLMRQDELFGEVGNKIVMESGQHGHRFHLEGVSDADVIFDLLKHERHEAIEKIRLCVEREIAHHTGAELILQKNGRRMCCDIALEHLALRAQRIVLELGNRNLYPSPLFAHNAIIGTLSDLRAIALEPESKANTNKHYSTPCDLSKVRSQHDFVNSMHQEADSIEKSRLGWLCLECCRAGAAEIKSCFHKSYKPTS